MGWMLAFRAAMSDPLKPLRVPGVSSLPEGEGRKVRFERDGQTEEVLLSRVGGKLYAADTYCPHEGGRLAEGPLSRERYAVCPLHLYRFDPKDGSCVGIECDPIKVYRAEEEDGVALVWIVEPEEWEEDGLFP